ncbi:PREDICTED: cytosolic sulfotransferase 5 [Theobroma cacao]|uniref:Sulfotransferase n=1 Tax=Theobroma cacao TaxID=3641 RepID=A0AB32X2T7_THECC|nr:PREDICTED: cytosolic sulfotransferase 5 [Theobroma cacao]XP_017984489.1 PREDICTED: cytosolic sulfotransferase 5 [Theobroma cacao]
MDSSEWRKPLDQLPKESFWDNPLYQWDGFWYRASHLDAAMALRSQYTARHDDVILASPMKTGTTWLKALCFCIMRTQPQEEDAQKIDEGTLVKSDDGEDPLAKNHPAVYVQTLEVQVFTAKQPLDISGMKSPRLFHTHLPYSALPDSIKNSKCKIVYIARNPKDTLVSMWHFFNKLRTPEQGPYPFDKAFECFCKGFSHFGPFLDHVLQYWNESLKAPDKVLFLKYEDLKRDPKGHVKKLALFLGRPFTHEKKVEEVIWRCSLERLKNLEVNKNGVDPWVGMPNSAFFRTGKVGDWKNMFTTEMSERLDHITLQKLEGSGLHLDI